MPLAVSDGSIELAGVRLKDTTGVLAVRNPGDTADAKLQIADGTAANHAVTKGQADLAYKKVLQVVHVQTGAVATGVGIIPIDDTIPQQTEGDQYMSLAITPIAATSFLRVDVTVHTAASAVVWLIAALFRDAGADSIGAMAVGEEAAGQSVVITYSVGAPANAITATTFKVRIGAASAATTTFNGSGGLRYLGGALSSSIRITEIAA